MPVACFNADLGGGDAVASSKLLPHPLRSIPPSRLRRATSLCTREALGSAVYGDSGKMEKAALGAAFFVRRLIAAVGG